MTVSLAVTLPAQPATGAGTVFTPFGGDGRSAPLGCYNVGMQLVGDAGGGNANLTVNFDPRYTSMVTWAQIGVLADTAAGEFRLQIVDTATSLPNVQVVGTLPGVVEAGASENSIFLWYPPPLYLNSTGSVNAIMLNVDATETYALDLEIYVFDRDVRQITSAQILNLTRIGVNNVPATG